MKRLVYYGVPGAAGLLALIVALLGSAHAVQVNSIISMLRPIAPFIALALLTHRFEQGEHQRGIWSMLALTFGMLIPFRVLCEWPLMTMVPTTIGFITRSLLTLVLNITLVAAAHRMAATWTMASLPGRQGRFFGLAGAVGAGFLVGAAIFLSTAARGQSFDEEVVLTGLSTMGDVASLIYLVPIARMARQLRGGLVGIPVELFFVGMIGAMSLDAATLLMRMIGVETDPTWIAYYNALGIFDDTLFFSIALAQADLGRAISRREA